MVTISDRKTGVDNAGDGKIDYYHAVVVSANDYYPFGMQMPGRKFNAGGYRYGFNGKEKDNEVKGEGAQYDYGFRIYDPRAGRFLSVDPLTQCYPWYTPYQFAGNKPIRFVDRDGLKEAEPAEFERAKLLITNFDNDRSTKSTWPGINKNTFVAQLNDQVDAKGYTVHQGNGWQCGVAAPTHLFVSRNPVRYVEDMISLYQEGYFLKADGKTKVQAPDHLTNIEIGIEGKDTRGLGMQAIDFMLLTTVRNDANSKLSEFNGTSNENIAGETWPTEVPGLLKDYFKFNVTKYKFYGDERCLT